MSTSKPVNSLISNLAKVKAEITELNKQVKKLTERRDLLESELIAAMKETGVDQLRNDVATVSLTETDLPQVEDWDRFYNFILRNKALYLLERRPASKAYREMLEMRKGRAIPGVKTFTKTGISLRKR